MVHLHRSRPSDSSPHASRHSAVALQRTRVVAVAVVIALLASISAGPMASAQEAPPPPTGDEATTLIPEIFEPGAIDRTPLASEVPGGQPSTSTGSAGVREPGEVVEARTEDSATFLTEEGRFETILYGGPVHYLDAQGAWQPIDNSLVPAEGSNGGLRNAAGAVDVSLPAVLGTEPVRVTKDDISVAFSLQGADASASPGIPEALPAAVTEATAKASATYANALPGVDVAYSANAGGVKEDLVLAGPEAPTTFDFTVETSPGLTASETPAGGIDFVDDEGTAQASFSPPFAYDASFESTGAENAFTEDGVSLSILETSPELVVRLAAEPAWLAASERVWPVVIDPELVIKPANYADTFLVKAWPNDKWGFGSRMQLNSAADARRPLLFRDVAAAFDEPVTVPTAQLQLYATTDTTGQAVSPVGVYELTNGWNANEASWNDRAAGMPWNSAGGDFKPEPLFVNPDATGPPGWRTWTITSSVQAWVDGEQANLGALLKYVDESSGALITFASSNEADISLLPRIFIHWEAVTGARDPFSFESFDLGPGGSASVNVASGNLTITDRDLGIPGTGLPATVDRFYQSRMPRMASVGARWRMWPQSEERLRLSSNFTLNQDVGVAGGPEELLIFSHNPDGSYTSPHGYRATMVKNPDGTYTLTSHGDGTRRNFYSSGYPKDVTDRNGNTITFGYIYDAASGEYFMSRMTDSQGRNTTFERAGQYKVTKMIDPAGRTHVYAYDRTDAKANLASYTDPAGKVTRYAYTGSVLGLLSRVTDPNGNVTAFAYDSRDRITALTRITDPLTGAGPTWRFDYSTPWQTKVTDPNGNATVHHFDRRGRVHKVIDALGHEQAGTYDSNSNVIDRTSAMGNKSISTFDTNNNLLTSTLPTGAKTTLDYTDAAHKYSPTKLTNAQGNASSLAYDTPGNVVSATDSMATAGVTTFAYNSNGTLASSTDAKGARTTYGYDAKGNRTSVTPPAPLGATITAYDGLSRVTSTTDGKGQTTTYAYDALDRPTRVGFADGLVVTLGYDAGGRLVERADATGTTAYVYDRLNRVVEERLPGGRVNAYAYDAAGNLASISDATGKVTYGYNAVNLATSVVEPGGPTTTFAYDDDNNRTATTYPNGVIQRVAYDASGRLTSVDGTKGTTVLTRFAYTYAAASGADTGLRQSVTDKANKTTAYSYDALDRLLQAKSTSSSGAVVDDFRYGYDAVGNRISETVRQSTLLGPKDVTTTATFNAADQLESRGSVTYSYDPNGNQTASSAGQALAYNAADQTTSLKRAGGTALPATYAGANQVERATAGTTTFTNSMLGLTVADAASATAYTRDPGGGLVGMRGAARSYYLFDGLGSVVAVTNANGGVTNSYTYDPYGVTTETKALLTNVINPWRYAGQYQDTTTGLYKMGARYYQPELGRWTQQDPSGQDANAYAYVGGSPVSLVDPSGLHADDWHDCWIFRYNNESGSCFGGSIDVEDVGTAAGYAQACFELGAYGAAWGGILPVPYGSVAGAIGGCAAGAAAEYAKNQP